jgi:hypothetical protein
MAIFMTAAHVTWLYDEISIADSGNDLRKERKSYF